MAEQNILRVFIDEDSGKVILSTIGGLDEELFLPGCQKAELNSFVEYVRLVAHNIIPVEVKHFKEEVR